MLASVQSIGESAALGAHSVISEPQDFAFLENNMGFCRSTAVERHALFCELLSVAYSASCIAKAPVIQTGLTTIPISMHLSVTVSVVKLS